MYYNIRMYDYINELKKENKHLQIELERLHHIERLYKALCVELKISNWYVGSRVTSLRNANGDVIKLNGDRIEVKYSCNAGEKGTRNIYWSWRRIFGGKNKKEFEELCLVGQFRDDYKYFLIPKNKIPKELMKIEKDKTTSIRIRHSFAKFSKYKTFLEQFEHFPLKEQT